MASTIVRCHTGLSQHQWRGSGVFTAFQGDADFKLFAELHTATTLISPNPADHDNAVCGEEEHTNY